MRVACTRDSRISLRSSGLRALSYALIHVSENASIAVENLCPAISRGAGLPGSTLPLTVIVAPVHGTNRLGIECLPVADLSGGSAKQNGVPSPLQVSMAVVSPALTV